MEAFVQSLMNRFLLPDGQKPKTPEEDIRSSKGMAFYLMAESAINELHNNGVIAALTPGSARLLHDSNPYERVTIKQQLAYQIAEQYLVHALPSYKPEGDTEVDTVWIRTEKEFSSCIALCIQKNMEFAHLQYQQEYKATKTARPMCILVKEALTKKEEAQPLLEKLVILQSMYEDIELMVYGAEGDDPNMNLSTQRLRLEDYADSCTVPEMLLFHHRSLDK